MADEKTNPNGTTWEEYKKTWEEKLQLTEKDRKQMKRWSDKIDRQIARRDFLKKYTTPMVWVAVTHALATILCLITGAILSNLTLLTITSVSAIVLVAEAAFCVYDTLSKILDLRKQKSLQNDDIKYLEYENYRIVDLNGLENITDISPIERNPSIKRYRTPDGNFHIKSKNVI